MSPELDALAASAWRFDQAVTVIPKTVPSFATLLTGRHPRVHGATANFDALPPELPTLAERLQEAGYRTAAFIGNPAIRASRGFDRGFGVFQQAGGRGPGNLNQVNEAFLRWAEEPWSQPTFVWIHFLDPHGPYRPDPRCAGRFRRDEIARADRQRVPLTPEFPAPEDNPNKVLNAIPPYQQLGPPNSPENRRGIYVARYDEEILCMDSAAARILRWLEAESLLDPAAVIFTSDHGEGLGEHGLFFEHGWLIHEASLRIPLLIKLPGQRQAGSIAGPVSNLDLLPTILSLAGISPDELGDVEGQDLSRGPALEEELAARPPVVVENSDSYPEKYFGLRGLDGQGRSFKYLLRLPDLTQELYDLEADPRESRNLASDRPEETEAFQGRLRRALAAYRTAAVEPGRGAKDDPEVLEQLRALGYAQ